MTTTTARDDKATRTRFAAAIFSGLATGVMAAGIAACGGEADQGAGPDSSTVAATSPAPEPEPVAGAVNEAPIILGLSLEPDPARPGDHLRAIVDARDPEGDSIRYRFTWTIDGEPISNAASDLILRNVIKGTEIGVSVSVGDSHSEGSVIEASTVVVNRAPQVSSITFEPRGKVTRAHDLTAVPRGFDADKDAIEFEYEWRINGRSTRADGDTLPSSAFRRDDEIGLRVRASDGEDRSDPFEIDTIVVVNAPPRIVSVPSNFDGRHFQYALDVEDPDGDRGFRFALTDGPSGMAIDFASGEVTWDPTAEDAGQHRIEIEVSDRKGGRDSQVFELSLGLASEQAPASLED